MTTNIEPAWALATVRGVGLRTVRESDLTEIKVRLVNDPATRDVLWSGYVSFAASDDTWTTEYFAITRGGKTVGMAWLTYDRWTRIASPGIALLPAARATGAGVLAGYLLARHAFERMGCVKLEVAVYSTNAASLRINDRYLTREGELRGHYFVAGQSVGCVQFGMMRDEWDGAIEIRRAIDRSVE